VAITARRERLGESVVDLDMVSSFARDLGHAALKQNEHRLSEIYAMIIA
jgi:hypothetical protein